MRAASAAAFSAITASPGAKAHYRRRRDDHGDRHAAAQTHLKTDGIWVHYGFTGTACGSHPR